MDNIQGMNYSNSPLHKEKYHQEPPDTHTKLKENETLIAFNNFCIEKEEKETKKNITVFIVETEKELIMRQMETYYKENEGFDNGTAIEIAKYSKEDRESFVKELNGMTLQLLKRVEETKNKTGMSVIEKVPLISVECKKDANNKELAIELLFSEKGADANLIQKQIIIQNLGLNPEFMNTAKEAVSLIEKLTKEKEEERPKIGFHLPEPKKKATINNEKLRKLDKIAEENFLILKYGKKNIAKAARQMGYKGVLINKTGKKSKTK